MSKMVTKAKITLLLCLAFGLALSGCSYPRVESTSAAQNIAQNDPISEAILVEAKGQELDEVSLDEPEKEAFVTPDMMAQPDIDENLEPTATPEANRETMGNASGAMALNPLTNEPCQDPSLLNLPPALVSVANFPVTARPQAGLSYAPYVFELSIGEGMTRFLALFYCAFPDETVSGDNTIGPIRSGRLPYESLRKLYNGFLIMASASGEVGAQLGEATNIFGSDDDNINSARIGVGKLKAIAQGQAGQGTPNLSGNNFDTNPPANGLPADRLWVFYSYLNQVMWTYDPASGAYLRAQDNADGSGQFTPSTDLLTGEPLAFENVVVFFVEHEVLNRAGTLIDVNLLYTLGKAYLFRDGQMIPVRWSTENGDYEKTTGKLRPIRFVDEKGNPVALKPGQVWVEFVHLTTTLSETESGMWKARFYAP